MLKLGMINNHHHIKKLVKDPEVSNRELLRVILSKNIDLSFTTVEIVEKDFKLKPADESSPFFDLELLYVIKPRGGKARLEFKNAGYGMTLASAIKKIAQYRVNCNHREEAIRLKAYFSEYKKELDLLKELLCDN